jgi:hypothetical protein
VSCDATRAERALARLVDFVQLVLHFAERVPHRFQERIRVLQKVLAILAAALRSTGRERVAELRLRLRQLAFCSSARSLRRVEAGGERARSRTTAPAAPSWRRRRRAAEQRANQTSEEIARISVDCTAASDRVGQKQSRKSKSKVR